MRNAMRLLILCAPIVISSTSSAASIPAKATPFTEDQVKQKYAGHSLNWDNGVGYGYMASDGKFTGYYGKTGDEGIADGTWSASGNEFCYNVTWTSKSKELKENYCWKLYMNGKKVLIEDTKKSDGGTLTIHPDKPPVAPGDKASAKYAVIKKMIGK